MPEENKSVAWTVGMLALVVAYFGWAFLAADYFQNDPSSGPGPTNFFVNSVEQLQSLPSVLHHGFQNRLWMIVLCGVIELGVLILWGVLKKVERELWSK